MSLLEKMLLIYSTEYCHEVNSFRADQNNGMDLEDCFLLTTQHMRIHDDTEKNYFYIYRVRFVILILTCDYYYDDLMKFCSNRTPLVNWWSTIVMDLIEIAIK